MKVEVYLELQGLEYRRSDADPRKGPKGKCPFIEVDGERIADSSTIIAYLEKKAENPLDHGMDDASRAHAHALKRLFEESFYWSMLWSRWGDDEGWASFRKLLDGLVPAPLRWLVPGIVRKKILAQCTAQGTGRHSPEEIYALGRADLDAMAGTLGDQPYFLGDELRTIDVTAFAFLANCMQWEVASPLTLHARTHPNLGAYLDRVRARITKARRSESEAPS